MTGMAEYIERGALMQFPIRRNHYDRKNGNKHFINGIESVLEYAENLPAADVAPVVHGRWIPLTECANEGVYCSTCKKKVWKSDYAQCSKKSRNKLESNYCPNCGAKMDEKEG